MHIHVDLYAVAQCLMSVCHEPVFYQNGWLHWADFWHRVYPPLCYKGIWVYPKIKVVPTVQTLNLPIFGVFARASRPLHVLELSSTSACLLHWASAFSDSTSARTKTILQFACNNWDFVSEEISSDLSLTDLYDVLQCKRVVKLIWQKGCVAAAHGRIKHIRQVAPLCTPIPHMLPWTHPSPQPGRHLNRLSHFCPAHDRNRQTDRPRYSISNNTPHLHK